MKSGSIICLISSLLCFIFLFSSCNATGGAGIAGAYINNSGELVIKYSNGKEENLGNVVGDDGDDGSLTVTAEGGLAAASSKGLRSAVSIVANFEATVQIGGWYPGSGGTTTKSYSALGSGVIYQLDKSEGDAFIVTNHHVVYDVSSNTDNCISDDINVYLYGSELDAKAIKATYVGGSLYYDIAVLRIEDSEILRESSAVAAEFADSDKVAVGTDAIAIGNAAGLGISTTSGIVSVNSEHITMTAIDERTTVTIRVMRIDTTINSGNSGGGVYNDEGELIGIVNVKLVYDGIENISYAIPSNLVNSVAQNIIDNCYGKNNERVLRAILGITVTTTDSISVYDTATGLVSIKESVAIKSISDGSLAEGNLMAGDTITSISIGEKVIEINREHQAVETSLDARVGDTVTVNVIRDGEKLTFSFTITEDCLLEY